MPRLTIDNHTLDVPPGTSLMDAARSLGIDVPSLCYLEGYAPNHSCLVCVMKVTQNGRSRIIPSCGAPAEEGMVVESESPEVTAARRTALELLLSDHTGDCIAPCSLVCPAHMDIPLMLRQITAEHLRDAIVTIKADIALPAVLGRVCPAPCERGGCRRKGMGGPLAICHLKQHAADVDLASGTPYLPPIAPATGKSVGIIGAGPAGLAAAYYLAQKGHTVTILDERDRPGGALRYSVPEAKLSRAVLDGEIDIIRRMGVAFRMNCKIGNGGPAVADLRREFGAVLVAAGALPKEQADPLGLRAPGKSLAVNPLTFATSEAGLFAAGATIRPGRLAVRSVAEGKAAAESIHQYLSGWPVVGPRKPFTVTIDDIQPDEMETMREVAAGDAGNERTDQPEAWDFDQAVAEAARCLHCDCRKASSCDLRLLAERYGADPKRYNTTGLRQKVELRVTRGQVVFEPGKCIKCGICVQITRVHGEHLGLAYIGRGFDVRPGVPFNRTLDEGLQKVAQLVVQHCPTGALAFASDVDSPLTVVTIGAT